MRRVVFATCRQPIARISTKIATFSITRSSENKPTRHMLIRFNFQNFWAHCAIYLSRGDPTSVWIVYRYVVTDRQFSVCPGGVYLLETVRSSSCRRKRVWSSIYLQVLRCVGKIAEHMCFLRHGCEASEIGTNSGINELRNSYTGTDREYCHPPKFLIVVFDNALSTAMRHTIFVKNSPLKPPVNNTRSDEMI